MEDSNYDSHILDVDREKLDLLDPRKPMDCNDPNFVLGHNVQIRFSIFMKFVKGILKVK